MSGKNYEKITPIILTPYFTPQKADTKVPDSFWWVITNLIRDASYSMKQFFVVASGNWRYSETIEQYGNAKAIVGRLFPPSLARLKFPLSSVYSIIEAATRGALVLFMHWGEIGRSKNKVILHAQTPETGIAAVFLSPIVNARVILSLHNIYRFSRGSSMLRKMLRILFTYFIDVTVGSSEKMKSELMKIGVPSNKIVVAPLWVNYSWFKPVDKRVVRKKLGLKDSDFIIFFAGRLTTVKGVEVLLQSLPELEKSLLNMKVIIAGGGPLEDFVLRTASTLKCLEYRGFLSYDELPLYYNAADITVVPSTYEEGFGLVIVESLACGTPVVGSNRGAIPEVLSGFKEYLIEPTPSDLTRKIIELHKKLSAMNASEIKELRGKLRDYSIKKFGKGARMYSEIYRTL